MCVVLDCGVKWKRAGGHLSVTREQPSIGLVQSRGSRFPCLSVWSASGFVTVAPADCFPGSECVCGSWSAMLNTSAEQRNVFKVF